jgi:hypothetical protein
MWPATWVFHIINIVAWQQGAKENLNQQTVIWFSALIVR